jgi:hypothetical protein
MDEVLKIAFVQPPEAIAWEGESGEAAEVVPPKEQPGEALTAH